MSLIQEALKRKIEEQNAGGTPVTPLAPPPAARPGPSGGGAFGRILGFAALIVLLLGVAIALFYLAAKNWNWKDAVAEAKADAGEARGKWQQVMDKAHAESASEAEEPAAVPAAVVPPPQPLASVQERVAVMKDKVASERAAQVEAEQALIPAPSPAVAVAPPPPVPAPAPTPPVLSRNPTAGGEPVRDDPKRKSVAWPKITVNGILAGGRQGGGAAILNNRMVSANETVEGAKVVEVQARGVLMEYKGETRLLLIGQTAD